MAGKHIGGSNSVDFQRTQTANELWEMPQIFNPSNDTGYAEGRAASAAGLADTDNPFGGNKDEAILINQLEAWASWNYGHLLHDISDVTPGFQWETAVIDKPPA